MEPGPAVKHDISEFLKIDEAIAEAKSGIKDLNATMREHRQRVIDYMDKSGVESMKAGSYRLCLTKRNIKVRPNQDMMVAKMRELMSQGITDPEQIIKTLSDCGGTKMQLKMSKRKIK